MASASYGEPEMLTLIWFIVLLFLPVVASGHEIVGEVTPLMERIKTILLLIENSRSADAVAEANQVVKDFPVPEKKSIEPGLKSSSERVDRTFGADSYKTLLRSLQDKNGDALKESLQTLGLLLMLEKFDVLQSTFGRKEYSLDGRRTIFWLGRNYFSYLLEPTLAKTDPVTEQALDRHLNRMLYRLEDGKWQEFVLLRQQLVEGILKAFNLTIPKPHAGPA